MHIHSTHEVRASVCLRRIHDFFINPSAAARFTDIVSTFDSDIDADNYTDTDVDGDTDTDMGRETDTDMDNDTDTDTGTETVIDNQEDTDSDGNSVTRTIPRTGIESTPQN